MRRAIILALGAISGPLLWSPEAVGGDLAAVTDRWYAIEVIVFQRSGVTAANSNEGLGRIGERSFPASVRSISNIPASDGYQLDPFTRATLEFPTLSFACPENDDSMPVSPTGVQAWYAPATARLIDRSSAIIANPPAETAGGDPGASEDRPTPLSPAAATETAVPAGDPTPSDAGLSADTKPSFIPCGPDLQPFDSSVPAIADACRPMPLDIPLAPEPPRALCEQPPGSPPPAIAPVLGQHPLLAWLSAVRRFEDWSLTSSYTTSVSGAILRREANRLTRASDLQVLWHGRWMQPVPSRSAPQPLLVQAGRRYDGIHELEGAIDITMGRYLHFQAQLWLHSAEAPGEHAPASERAATSIADSGSGEPGAPATPTPYMVLEESRTMRSGALHYLDHPKLGVLVRADPVQPPDWLVAASVALESAELGD